MQGRKFKVLSVILFDTRFPDNPDKNSRGNGVEFIEVKEQVEMGETIEVEVRPSLIKDAVGLDIAYNEYASMMGVIVRPIAVLNQLLAENKIQLL